MKKEKVVNDVNFEEFELDIVDVTKEFRDEDSLIKPVMTTTKSHAG